MKPKLLIMELWGLGDLVIATPFLRAAAERFDVTLVAKPYALDLQQRLWPGVRVRPFVAPWTAFKGKYRLWRWPWLDAFRLLRELSRAKFDVALSARWDPRDHILLALSGAATRLGFSRLRSEIFLTRNLRRPDLRGHRYEYWRALGRELGLSVPEREAIPVTPNGSHHAILVHTGAGQPIRVWPLERYRLLVQQLRADGFTVLLACDPDQRDWWRQAGEPEVQTPETVAQLLALVDRAGVFVGNDSGPGHLAAACGLPTFTVFGPQLPEWFAPLHPRAEWVEGEACPYKPCSDYCRFDRPRCMTELGAELVIGRLRYFLRNLSPPAPEKNPAGAVI
ncbi:MAG: glycosyltransferase family 9 protein [Verrucomicrobia bacterium]|nr:MAG: glycosyltransferase family 9 protein [Verrucomicrobiota bacterium]